MLFQGYKGVETQLEQGLHDLNCLQCVKIDSGYSLSHHRNDKTL